jgi:hypothetical protein
MPSDDPTIDEASRRWPDWQPGMPVVLPDGQTWHFAAPEATVRAGLPGWTFGPDVPRDVDAILSGRLARILEGWSKAEDEAGRAAAILTAAWFLLARNYAITHGEFGAILGLAAGWDDDRQRDLGERLMGPVTLACVRSSGLMEVA